jgi:hypothetical protein
MSRGLREISKDIFSTNGQVPSLEHVNAGSLQRIADALEKVSANYNYLLSEKERYKKWYEQECNNVKSRDRVISALRGQITKLKRK